MGTDHDRSIRRSHAWEDARTRRDTTAQTWRTEAFIGTLRRDGLDRNCSFEAAINGEIFPVDNEQIIVPKLRSCDIFTADDLPSQPARVRRSKVSASLLSFAPIFGTSIFA
jgi:hypothetical protein